MAVNGFPKLTDFPAWDQAQAQLVKVQLKLIENDKAQTDIRTSISGEAKRRRSDMIDEKARALLLNGSAVASDEARSLQLSELKTEAVILRRAEQMARQDLDKLRTTLSNEICEPLVPQHQKLVKDIADAVRALALANQREHDFREQLDQGGIVYMRYLRPMLFSPGHVGKLDDDYSMVSMYLREASEHGFLTEREVVKMRNGGA